jgi:heme exporter protein B
MKTNFWQTIKAIIWKDLAVEFRNREMLSSMLVFALIVMVIFNFALELQPNIQKELTSGILWVLFSFAGTLGLNRSMAVEKDRGCLDGLLLAPVDRSAIFFGKAISNLILMMIVEMIILPIYSILYSVNLFQPGLIFVILLGSIGYITVGTLLSSMVIQTRSRDIMLPILLFPLVIPVLIAAVKAGAGFLMNVEMSDILPWINLLVVYSIIFLTIALLVFDFVVEE